MALADPWYIGHGDTDRGFSHTPSGNTRCPDDEVHQQPRPRNQGHGQENRRSNKDYT